MKKIRNNISKYAVLLALTATPLVITSCRQELDINVDPNNPSQASLSGLLSASQVGFAFALGVRGLECQQVLFSIMQGIGHSL